MRRRLRLTESNRFYAVRQNGRTAVCPLLVMRALSNGLDYSRFGFVVGKRIGNAVVRNRVKRRLREAVRQRLADIPAGLDVVFVARAPITGASWETLCTALDRLLRTLPTARSSEGRPDAD